MRSKKLLGLLAIAALNLASGNKAMAQDAEAGGKVFKQQCMACHSPLAGKNLVGPSLFGVVDRPAGSIPNFHYSAANKGSGITWDAATLDRYLKAPKEVVPGTIMPYAGLKNDTQRADLIVYLATLK